MDFREDQKENKIKQIPLAFRFMERRRYREGSMYAAACLLVLQSNRRSLFMTSGNTGGGLGDYNPGHTLEYFSKWYRFGDPWVVQ